MAGFVQIIEFTTTQIDAVKALGEEMREQGDAGLVVRGTFTSDRDRPNTYLNIIEFESYESAMENSDRPETSAFAARMGELCDGPPTFYNLDVMDTWTR
ncbi:hypothetical protein [Nocardioides pelophilus]|uniref:hypothetical protein n=1 Tax=Nocardioides pelophilus TaxID=2172019 RepID=UPI0016046E79|nr:hypothetical protein [Nocardioides pelophilus]